LALCIAPFLGFGLLWVNFPSPLQPFFTRGPPSPFWGGVTFFPFPRPPFPELTLTPTSKGVPTAFPSPLFPFLPSPHIWPDKLSPPCNNDNAFPAPPNPPHPYPPNELLLTVWLKAPKHPTHHPMSCASIFFFFFFSLGRSPKLFAVCHRCVSHSGLLRLYPTLLLMLDGCLFGGLFSCRFYVPPNSFLKTPFPPHCVWFSPHNSLLRCAPSSCTSFSWVETMYGSSAERFPPC